MERRNGAALCPRLIDYFVMVAGRNPAASKRTVCTSPEIIRRYPLKDHDDFPLPSDVSFFCQPEGCLNVTRQQMSSLVKNSSFVFCLTDKDSNKVRYGVCYNFYQLRSFEAVKSNTTDGEPHHHEDSTLLAAPHRHHHRKRYQLISICILSHHPFFTTFRDILMSVKRIIDRYEEKIQRLVRSHHFAKKSIWDFLLNSVSSLSLSQLVHQDIKEIDTYILRLLSSPVPVPGKTRVEITLGPASFHAPVIFALPDRTRFSLVDFPLHLILELIGIDRCLLILTAILLESKVVLQSRDYNALTMSVLGLISMLYPLEYMFPVIPLLPTCLRGAENLLLAPTPFLIGAPATFLMYKRDFQLPDDIWLFNLDTGEVKAPSRLEKLPSLPEPEGSLLKTRFSQALASLSLANVPMAERSGRNQFMPSDPDSVDVAIRMAVVRFFVSENVLGNWSDHTRIMRLYPRPVIGFQHSTFLKSRPAGCHFTALLVKTQAVECFCEWALCPDNDAWLRVLSGLTDFSAIGDKSRWFASSLVPVSFQLIDFNSALSKRLNSVDFGLNNGGGLSNTVGFGELTPTDDSCSGEESDSSTSANISLTSIQDYVQDILSSEVEVKYDPDSVTKLTVEEDEVYAPPIELQLPDMSSQHVSSAAETTDSDGASTASEVPSNNSSPVPARKNLNESSEVDDGSLAERRGGSRLAPVLVPEPSGSASSDIDKTPQPDEAQFAHFSPEKHPKQLPASPSNSSAVSTDSSGVDMSTRDVFAAMKSDVTDIANSAKAKAKNATKQLSGFLDEMATANKRPDSNRDRNVSAIPPSTSSSASGSMLVKQGSIQGPARPPPPTRVSGVTAQQQRQQQQIPQQLPQPQPAHVKPLLAASEAIRKHLPSPQQARRVTSKLLAGQSSQASGQHSQSYPTDNVERNSHVRRSYRASADLAQRQQSIENKSQQHMESQQFLSEIVQGSFEGQTLGWLKQNRIKKLLEDETYRLYLLSKINTQLSRKYRDEDANIEDIVLSRKQFKAFIHVIRATVSGLETSYRNGAAGGMASAFLLLEVAHTHYWQPDYGIRDPDALPVSNMATLSPGSVGGTVPRSAGGSPFGSREQISSQSGTIGSTSNEAITPSNEESGFVGDGSQGRRPSEITVQSRPSHSPRRSSGSPSTVGPTSGQALLKSALSSRRVDSSDSLSSATSSRHGIGATPSMDPNIGPKTIMSLGYRYRGAKLLTLARSLQPSREYLFQHIIGKDRSWLWDQMGFWEEAFIDTIAHERDLVGYDLNPQEMIQRYGGLTEAEKKRLELDEDRLLSVLLFNAAGFMLMMNCNKNEIRRKIRRLLGKSHMGLSASQSINRLLDSLNYLVGNDIDLRVSVSRLVRRYTFPVHMGTDNSGEMMFVEVCSDSIMLRSVSGQQRDRWWFDRLINMTYSPRTKVLCLWMKTPGDQVELNQFYTRKCRDLYNRIKAAMEQTAAVNRLSRPGPNLYAAFHVQEVDTGNKVIVQVTPNGVCISDSSKKDQKFIDLCHVKRAYAQMGNTFVLELFDQDFGALKTLKMFSDQADQICYNVLCVISMAASSNTSSGQQTPSENCPSPIVQPSQHQMHPPQTLSMQSQPHQQQQQQQQQPASQSSVLVNVKLDSLQSGSRNPANQKW